MVKNKDSGKVSLLCNIDASEDELKLRHRDLDIFQIYAVEQPAAPSGEVVVYYNPTASENLTVSTSSISYATIADIANYEKFGESSQPSNIVVNKTFEWKSNAFSGDLHYAVSMIDKTGIKGNISEVNARLLKLTTPTVTDTGDSTTLSGGTAYAHILYLGGETFGSVKASHAKTASSDGRDIDTENVSTQVTIQYTLKEYKQSGDSVPTPPATSGTPDSDVTIDIGKGGEKMYELILWAEAPGYASSNSMRYIFTVQSKIYVDKSGNQINAGFEDTPLPSLQAALNKISNLKTKNPKIVLKSDIEVSSALTGFKQGDGQDRLTITSADINNPKKITMKKAGTNEISFSPSSGATVELVSVKIVGGVKAISNTKLTIAGNSEITNGSGQSGAGLTVDTNASVIVGGDTKISGRSVGISNSGTLSIGDNACICPPQENGSYSTGMRGLSCKNGTVTIMEQAKIEHCQQSGGGGLIGSGIYISGGTVTMQGGTISNCKSLKGGAVYVDTGGTFSMTGGTIKNNIATIEGTSVEDKGNGGGIYNKGTVYLSGNAIIGDNTAAVNATEDDHSNYAEGAGGGIYNEGTLYLGANNGGNGSVVANGSPYIMHNYSKENGGGIYNANGKSITHYSCSIKYNGNSGGQYGYRNNVFMHWTGQYELKKVGYGEIGSIYLFGGHDNGVTTNPYNTPTVSFGTLISALSPKIPLYVPFDCPNNTQLVTKDVNNGTQQIPNSFTVTVFTQGPTGGIQQEQKTLDTDGRLSN
ncbi:MAG: hypothetical protein IJU92_03850 [Spirochaetaceae bacterium]|nr:hypothetical protein [Spirochaetaceae bacterium]